MNILVFTIQKCSHQNVKRTVILIRSQKVNGIYTLFELAHSAYKDALSCNNIAAGFKACGKLKGIVS